MELGLTIPLQHHIKSGRPPYGDPAPGSLCWDLHVIQLQGSKSLLAVHCETRYTFVLYGLTAAQWSDLPATFLGGLQHSFLAAGVPPPAVKEYLARAGAPCLTRTHGRREVAFLNRAWNDVIALDYAVVSTQCSQPVLDLAVNRTPSRAAGWPGTGRALERLRQSLKLEFD